MAPNEWPLNYLKAKRDAVKTEVGVDAQKQKKYDELEKWMALQRDIIPPLAGLDIKDAEAARTRRQEFIDLRRKEYSQIFGTLTEEEHVLRQLYAPLKRGTRRGSGRTFEA